MGTSDYAACYNDTEVPIDDDNNGLLFRNSKIRFADILDGSSYTILVGETIGDVDALGWLSGTRATLRNTDKFEDIRYDEIDEMERGALETGSFDSYHAGGGNFAMADGAVVFMTHSIDELVYQHFGNRADGELIGDFDNQYWFIGSQQRSFYFLTDQDAPTKRVVAMRLDHPGDA